MQLTYDRSIPSERFDLRIFGLRSPWSDRLLVVLFALLVRLPGLPPSVMDWDESVYILAAREILHGRLPYVGVFDDKPLGGPSLIALALATLGQSVLAVRLLGLAGVAATSVLLHATAMRAGLARPAALAAALLYAAFTTQLNGLSTNTELLFAPFTVAAFCVAVGHVDERRPLRQYIAVAACGLLFGIGIWIKYVVALPAAALFAGLVGSWLWRRRTNLLAAAASAAIYGSLCLLPTLLTAALYWRGGLLDLWWYCNFGYMSTYLGLPTPLAETFHLVQANLLAIWPLLLLSGLALPMVRRAPRAIQAFVAAVAVWALVEAAAVVAPQKFFDHYFLVLLPPLSLLSGLALAEVARRVIRPELHRRAAPVMAVCVTLVPLAAVAAKLSPGWLNLGKSDVPRQVAALIRGDTQPDPTLWVVNSEPVIYFLAGVPSPTRFPFPPHLVGSQSGITRSDPAVEIARVLATHPRYLVVDEARWDEVQASLQPMIRDALARDYTLADSIPSKPADVDVFRVRPEAIRSPVSPGGPPLATGDR